MFANKPELTAIAILSGLLLDCLIGDPAFTWHPVRVIGRWASLMEGLFRRLAGSGRQRERLAGTASWLLVLLPLCTSALLGRLAMYKLHIAGGLIFDSLLVWVSIAPRDLSRHALAVKSALAADQAEASTLPTRGRIAVGRIVGRDVSQLDYEGCARACVESVAESSVDGVCAPLFWAAVLGPVGALAYRAINTMDSMFGHRDERYQFFGYTAARMDDLANWLPARLSSWLAIVLAPLAGGSIKAAFDCYQRDRYKHTSPNAGHPESVYAGAFGIRLGGPVRYAEGLIEKSWMNASGGSTGIAHIRQAIRLMWLQSIASALAFTVVRLILPNQ